MVSSDTVQHSMWAIAIDSSESRQYRLFRDTQEVSMPF